MSENIKMWPALIHLDGWAGRTEQAVTVVGETPKRYRVQPVGQERVCLAGRGRSIGPGETALVPKKSVSLRPIYGFHFLIVEGNRKRWVQFMGSGGLFGDGALATVKTDNICKLLHRLLLKAQRQLERDGEIRVLKSWDLPPAERFETTTPSAIDGVKAE